MDGTPADGTPADGTPARRPGRAPVPGGEDGGDSVCWLDRVCDACGGLADGPPAPVCDRCGTPRP